MMKKILFSLIVLSLLLPTSLMAADSLVTSDNPCLKMWHEVTGQTYSLTLDGNFIELNFSAGFVGPCPQGNVIFLLNEEVLGTYEYATTDDLVYIKYNDTKLTFVLANGSLYLIDGNVLSLKRKTSGNRFVEE